MYTSGWPKNQNRCWYKIGSPPPDGSKNAVLKLRSVNNIVIAPAKTGTARSSKTAVTKIDQTNKGSLYIFWPGFRIFKIVEIKFTAPRMDDAPDKCKLKIAKSTAAPEWLWIELKGGYTVQPVPTPTSTTAEANSKHSDGGNNQNEILFKRGKRHIRTTNHDRNHSVPKSTNHYWHYHKKDH